MSWKGVMIGGCLGSFILKGPLGALLGALIGNYVEKKMGGGKRVPLTGAQPNTVFLASAAAMFAKLAKADGVVTKNEIAAVEHAFVRLRFSPQARAYAIAVFRRAKDDSHSIYEYAADFAAAVPSVEVREFLYGLLWDLACADAVISTEEMEILRNVTRSLAIRPQWFNLFAQERIRGSADAPPPREEDSLADAYRLLGVEPTADDATVRKAYREKAKKYHPDALRAQGLPDEMVSRATEMMAKVNAAWNRIEKARGL